MDVKAQVKDEREDEPSLVSGQNSGSSLSKMPDIESPVKPPTQKKALNGRASARSESADNTKTTTTAAEPSKPNNGPAKESQFLDPEADNLKEAGEREIQAALFAAIASEQ